MNYKSINDYLVIVGNLVENEQNLRRFLINHYQGKNHRKTVKFIREILLVSEIECFHDPNCYIQYETLKSEFKIKRIKHLQAPNLYKDITWVKKAQLHKASALICFHMNEQIKMAL